MRVVLFSHLYRALRWVITGLVYCTQHIRGRCPDLESAIHIGDALLTQCHTWRLFKHPMPNRPPIAVCGLPFPSPVTIAAFKADVPSLNFWLALGAGGVCLKTMRLAPTPGNPRPRIAELSIHNTPCLINALGLPSDGIESTLNTLKNSPIVATGRPIGLSIYGDSLTDYEALTNHIIAAQLPGPHYIEINSSCPNLGHDTNNSDTNLVAIIQSVRTMTPLPISIKLSPMWSDHTLDTLLSNLIDCPNLILNSGNSHYHTLESLGLHEKTLSMPGGGLTGPPIFSATLARVKTLSQYQRPIIATGGISTPGQARAVLDAGATLVGIASGVVFDPYCIVRINHHYE